MNKMLGYLNGYKRESVLAPLFKMLEATFDLFVPLVMADIVNVGIAARDFHYILVRCGLLLLLAAIGLACSLTAQYFSAKAAVGYSTALRHALFAHIQSLSFSEMDTLGTSTLITRMTSDVNQVQSGLNLFLRLFLRSPFVVIGAMVMAFTVNVKAALIFVVTIPLLSVVVFGIMAATRPMYKTVQNRLDRVLGLTRENLTGVRVVRAFDKEKDEVSRFENANALLTDMQLHVGHISALMNPVTYVVINLAVVLVVISQIKINVTNAYSGSLAWTSAWTRTTKRYPGRIIFVVVNLAIALALMEGDMFSALSWILGFYSNFAIAWVVVVATDITFNKGLLKLAPAQPEYRRGMIYNVNPVGVVSFGLAAGLSICAFFGLLGATLAPFSPLIALVVAFVMTPLMGLLTRGRYYIKQVDDGIAEPRYDAAGNASSTVYQCVSCEEEYERPDVMHSHKHQGAICSLCKSME